MDLNNIATFIREKRRKLGLTQEELAQRLFVTEKAVSRWETGRGTPDISLLLPLCQELGVEVSELLTGKDNSTNDEIATLINYVEKNKEHKFNTYLKLTICFYVISIFTFLVYLKFEYNPNIELNYFLRLTLTVIASIFVIIGNKIYGDKYVEKIEDKRKVLKLSQKIVFTYYLILLFNMTFFARFTSINTYNLVIFKTIKEMISTGSIKTITINIFGNLFIFMPMEYFIIEIFKIKNKYLNFVISLGISVIIELIQFVFKVGVFDIDDIILTTAGMVIFNVVYNFAIKKLNVQNSVKH